MQDSESLQPAWSPLFCVEYSFWLLVCHRVRGARNVCLYLREGAEEEKGCFSRATRLQVYRESKDLWSPFQVIVTD